MISSRIIKVEVRVITRSWRLGLITLSETLILLEITKTESKNCFIIHWTKNGGNGFASSLTTSNTKRANLTWLPLETVHRSHTWHDYCNLEYPWHDYCINRRHACWFRKFTAHFRPIRKEILSSKYNNSDIDILLIPQCYLIARRM